MGPDGSDVAEGEAGTLWIKGESAAILYWQAHEKSKQVLRGDWVVTGDHMRRDAQGYFWYEGRTDDMLKVGGIFVSPLEVENCLLQHEAVAECAVIGYKDADGLDQTQGLRGAPAAAGRRRTRPRAAGVREAAPGALQVPAGRGVRSVAPEERPGQDRSPPARSRSAPA